MELNRIKDHLLVMTTVKGAHTHTHGGHQQINYEGGRRLNTVGEWAISIFILSDISNHLILSETPTYRKSLVNFSMS